MVVRSKEGRLPHTRRQRGHAREVALPQPEGCDGAAPVRAQAVAQIRDASAAVVPGSSYGRFLAAQGSDSFCRPLSAQSRGLKLYVPSTAQLGAAEAGHDTSALPWNQVNFPVPPENVQRPRPVAKSSLQWPDALLLPGPGG
jgi:hypothetical protein